MEGARKWPVFPILIVVEDGRGKRRLECSCHQPLWLGSDPGCDVVLLAQKASPRHASIEFEGGKLVLKDADSQHGTFWNDARVTKAELDPGDRIVIGSARIWVLEKPIENGTDTFRGRSAPAASAPSVRRRARGGVRAGGVPRKKSWTPMILGVVVSAGLLGAAAMVFAPRFMSSPGGKPTEGGSAAGASLAAGAGDSGGAQAESGALRLDVPGAGDSVQASSTSRVEDKATAPTEILAEVLSDAEQGTLGWGVIEQLEQFVKTYPQDEARPEVERFIRVLAGTRRTADKGTREQLALALEKVSTERRYGDAIAAARFLAGASADKEQQAFWEKKAGDAEAAARSSLRALEEEVKGLLLAEKSAEAMRALADARRQFSSMGSYLALVDSSIGAALAPRVKSEEGISSAQALQLKDLAALAFDECDYRKVALLSYSLLAVETAPEARLKHLEAIVDAHHFERMLGDFLLHVSIGPVEAANLDGFAGRILRADKLEYEYELDIEGRKGAAKRRQPWNKLPPPAKFALFDSVPAPAMSPEGLMGLAAFAFRLGDEEGGQRQLLRLYKRPESQDFASAVLARHLGIQIPKDGFVEFKGRLVTPEARAADLERQRKAEEEDKIARAELKKAQKDARVGSLVEQARKLRKQGSFTIAHALLVEIAKKFPKAAPGKEAIALLEDPILSVHTLQESGQPKNRLDFYLLGDGYPDEDGYQSAFLTSANTALKILLNEEPFKEYASYLNFYAVQLASKEQGLDHLPGGQDKDTAVGGQIEYDVFTSDRSRAMAIIQRVSNGAEDGQAIVIGNDYAGVSTGGGGVANVCKLSFDALAHEIGHSLGGLHDEYDSEPGNDPKKAGLKKRGTNVPVSPKPPNLMSGSDKAPVLDAVIWKNWIDAGSERWWNGSKVEAFEGGDRQLYDVWRPQMSCKMRDASTAFCVVCMEVMVKAFYRRVRPIDRAEPPEKEITLKNNEDREVKIWPMKPATRLLEVQWFLQELPSEEQPKGPTVVVSHKKEELHKSFGRRVEPDGRPVEFAILRGKDLSKGKRFRLRVEVRDPTLWILKDDEGLLKESREWVVKVGEK